MSILISYGGRRCHEMYDCTEIETMSMSVLPSYNLCQIPYDVVQ